MMRSPDSSSSALIARAPAFDQHVIVAAPVLEYMACHRQLSRWSKEAGGQLFGTFTSQELQVLDATGPYKKDSRSRYSYRSDPVSAQSTIDVQSGRGLNYVGEWHTHPERLPTASGDDIDAVGKLVRRSTLRISSVLLLIQGTEASPRGLALYSCDGQTLTRWKFVE